MTWLRKGTPFSGARTDMQIEATGSPVETVNRGTLRRKVTRSVGPFDGCYGRIGLVSFTPLSLRPLTSCLPHSILFVSSAPDLHTTLHCRNFCDVPAVPP